MNLFPINSPDQRQLLEPRDKPYFVRVTDDLHLGYKKGKSISRWVLRRRISSNYTSHTMANIIPDDVLSADGICVLSFDQAITRALAMTRNENTKSPVPQCNFCNKPQNQVEQLIAGQGSYICTSCVNVCNDILENQTQMPTHNQIE